APGSLQKPGHIVPVGRCFVIHDIKNTPWRDIRLLSHRQDRGGDVIAVDLIDIALGGGKRGRTMHDDLQQKRSPWTIYTAETKNDFMLIEYDYCCYALELV